MKRNRAAFLYDWRARFQMSLDAVGTSAMPWPDALELSKVLATDPSSMIFAALAGWESPRSREWMVLADLFDLQHKSKSRRHVKPYPRPIARRRFGKTRKTRAEVIRILNQYGHHIPEE